MESFSINGVVQAEYVYNALGQQVVRRLTQAGQTIHSVHDLAGNRIAEYGFDPLTSTSTLLREYIWLDGAPVAMVDGATGAVSFVRSDHIGRPVFATDDLGVKVWEATYLPFGGVRTSTGANTDLRFPGQWFHASSGLHQNWMRDYDPTTGRYIQADPLGLVDGASVYGYALQNPGRYIDPTGEFIPVAAAAGRAAMACWRNPACRAAAGAAIGAAVGWLVDEDGCYEWNEALWYASVGAAAAAPHYWATGGNVRGGGVRLWKDGPGVEWHRFGLGATGNKTMVNRPHFHAGRTKNQMKKHRPWEGGWRWW